MFNHFSNFGIQFLFHRQSRVGSGVASPNNPDSPREISQNSHMSLAAQWEQKYSK